jgi:hypothetical protein
MTRGAKMKVFIEFVTLMFQGEHRIVSIGMIDSDGYTFNGEFREFDSVLPQLNELVGTNEQVGKTVEGLKYKDMRFIDNVNPFYSIPKPSTDQDARYSFEIKGWDHQVAFEMNAWLSKIYEYGDEVTCYANPKSQFQWMELIGDSEYGAMLKAQPLESFIPLNTGIPWDEFLLEGKPVIPPTVINVMERVKYMKDFYTIEDIRKTM